MRRARALAKRREPCRRGAFDRPREHDASVVSTSPGRLSAGHRLLREQSELSTATCDRERFGAAFPAGAYPWLVGRCLAERGRVCRGNASGRGGIRLAETVDHPWSLVIALSRWPGVPPPGDLSKAIPVLERGLRLCQPRGPAPLLSEAGRAGLAYALAGRLAEGLPCWSSGGAAPACKRSNRAFWLIHLSEAYRLAGRSTRPPRCHVAPSRARASSRNEATRPKLCASSARSPRTGSAEIETGRNPLPPGHGARRGAGHAPARGPLPPRPRQALPAHGQAEQAREHLTTATTMYREMDMRFWLKRRRRR